MDDTKYIRKGCKDIWNAFMLKGAVYSKNDIPFCRYCIVFQELRYSLIRSIEDLGYVIIEIIRTRIKISGCPLPGVGQKFVIRGIRICIFRDKASCA